MCVYSDLEMTERHIARAMRHIAQQRKRILELRARGDDDQFSQALLANLICGLTAHQLYRENLVRKIQYSAREAA